VAQLPSPEAASGPAVESAETSRASVTDPALRRRGRGTPRSSARRLRWPWNMPQPVLTRAARPSPRRSPMKLGPSVGLGGTSPPAHHVVALRTAWHGTSRASRVGDRAAEQADAADEAGASDGASQLIRSVRRTVPSPMVVD
jgi:hypothetical protein